MRRRLLAGRSDERKVTHVALDAQGRDLEDLPLLSPYQEWQRGERVPIHEGTSIPSLHTLEVGSWERVGQRGALVTLAEQERDDGQLIEISPGSETKVLHHLYESLVFVVEGRGATTFWQPDGAKQTVEWRRGSLFSPPLNCYYQHFNLDGEKPARLFAVTSAPLTINLYHNESFVFENDFVFRDRYGGERDFFSDDGRRLARRVLKTNFVPDVREFPLPEWRERGAGGKNVVFALSSNTMVSHVSEFPIGTYKKAHRHTAGAHVIIIGGEGYSLLWFEGDSKKERIDWQDGTVLSPADNQYHQHFNIGNTPARYLALRWNSPEFPPRGFNQTVFHTGPEQVEYEDQDPEIHETFVEECARRGVQARDVASKHAESVPRE
jgi:mannose-6-phosphate isomerase-like protein (cupin superfamily)